MTTPKIFQLRLNSDLHEAIRQAAFKARKSINQWIIEAIIDALTAQSKEG